ncbi:MAG: hypothetical protein OIF48_10625 [Silicimonas sp.]|nr:hypothetical protein [Silicimonas sp.]
MHFDDILATLRDNGKSGMAYQKTIARADAAMAEDPDRAVGYRLLCALAERFLDGTGRLPVTTQQTEQAFEDFAAAAEGLRAAYEAGESQTILEALNATATQSRAQVELTTRLDD